MTAAPGPTGGTPPKDSDLYRAFGQTAVEADRSQRLTALSRHLTRWLREGEPQLGDVDVVELVAPGGGASSDLVVATLDDGRRFVVRLQPSDPIYPDADLGRQQRCSLAAARYGTHLVPEPLWYDPDPEPLGAPFLVSTFAHGKAGTGRFEEQVTALTVAEQRRVWTDAIGVVAAVHSTDLAASGLRDRLPVDGDGPVGRALGYWRRYRAFVDDGADFPVLDGALDELEATRPAEDLEETLVWGDARFGNLLYVGLEPAAAVDFEFAHVGLPGLDVAFFAHFDSISFEYFRPGKRLPGFGSLEETFDLYEATTGRRLGDRRWHHLLAATYSALAVTKVMQLRAADGLVPTELVRTHPSMRALADLLEDRR